MANHGIAKAYLVLYNSLQAVGWGLCLVALLRAAAAGDDVKGIYETGKPYARWTQYFSFLEILHAATGLVPSNPFQNFLQWLGKANALYRLAGAIPELQHVPATPLMMLCWSLGEVIRYPWYALTELGACPYWLTWLRYSVFLLNYPVGVVCEMVLMWMAVPFLRERDMFSIHMPNAWNWAWDYSVFIHVMFYLYPFLWWGLFSTLLRQRSKKLGPVAQQGRAAAAPNKVE